MIEIDLYYLYWFAIELHKNDAVGVKALAAHGQG